MIADCFKDIIERYVDDVLEGRIVASEYVRAAVERHVKDMQRESTSEFPYHFCWKSARRACMFYPKVLKHTIGRFSGMPLELEPWQMFCEASIFGWKRDADETRRFRKAYESVARKNGKSTRAAARAIYMAGFDHNPIVSSKTNKSFTPEPAAQVVLCAAKKEQVEKVIYAEIERMRSVSTKVREMTKDSRRHIEFYHNHGDIICVGSDKPYDGLNPHMVVMDELHAWDEYRRRFYDTMVTGSGYRDQPLISWITTAGDDRATIWKEVYEYSCNVLSGTIEDDSYFAFIAQIDDEDDPLDEDVWLKANPNLGVSVDIEYLRDQAKQTTTPQGMSRFVRYHCNRLSASKEKAFDIGKWRSLEGQHRDWRHADAIGAGVDLGGYDDLAAVAFVARFDNGEKQQYEVKTFAYLSKECSRDITRPPFVEWIFRGFVEVVDAPINTIIEKIIEYEREFGIYGVAFDPYGAQQLGETLTQQGIVAARMAQTCHTQNEPIRYLQKLIDSGDLTHDGNELLAWCINNAVISRNRQDRWMLDKASSAEKIDPVVAMVMALRMAMIAPARAKGTIFIG